MPLTLSRAFTVNKNITELNYNTDNNNKGEILTPRPPALWVFFWSRDAAIDDGLSVVALLCLRRPLVHACVRARLQGAPT